jgi:hypothetical protein
MIELLIGFSLFAVAWGTRWFPVRNAITNFDTYFYLHSIQQVKKQRIGISGALSLRLLPSTQFPNPYLWQWVLGFLPASIRQNHHQQINICLDALFSVFLFYVSRIYGLNFSNSLIIYLLYLFSPAFFSTLSMGPRISSLTPRLSSEIVANIFFIVLYGHLPFPKILIIVSAVSCAVFILLSSKFGIQVLLFLVPLTSLIAWEYSGIISLLLALIISATITRGGFINAFKAQIHHLTTYFKKNLSGKMYVSNRNSIAKLIKPFNEKHISKNKMIQKFFQNLLITNSFTGIIIKLPVFLLVPALWCYCYYYNISVIGITNAYLAPVIAATVVFIIVNVKYFLFLGEAERYINHVSFFVLFIALTLTNVLHLHLILYLLIGYGIIYWLFEAILLDRFLDNAHNTESSIVEVIDSLNKRDLKNNIALYPYHAVGGAWRLLHETNHNILYPITIVSEQDKKRWSPFDGIYPYFNILKFSELAAEFNISILIINATETAAANYINMLPEWERLSIDGEISIIYEKKTV